MQDIMGVKDIAFPNLGIYLRNVPKSFSVFGFEISLYGVIIGFGFLLGVMLAAHLAKKEELNPDMIWDLAIYEIIFSIIGARIYYVIFAWDLYKDDLWSIVNIRKGGLAIYGGVIAGALTLAVYSRIKKVSFLQVADICAPALVLGQAIGRWGNFTNREVFGEYTDNLLAMRLPVDAIRSLGDISESIAQHMSDTTNYIQVHPTFLYESLWNFALLLLLLAYRKQKRFQGEIWLLYLGGYGLGRAWIEGIRTDTLFLPRTEIAVSQLLAVVLAAAAFTTDIVVRLVLKRREKVTPTVTVRVSEEHRSGMDD